MAFSKVLCQFLSILNIGRSVSREGACIVTVSCCSSQASFGLASVSTLLCTMQEAVRSRKSVGLWCVSAAKVVARCAVGPFVYKELLDREPAVVHVCLQVHVRRTAHVGRFCGKMPAWSRVLTGTTNTPCKTTVFLVVWQT